MKGNGGWNDRMVERLKPESWEWSGMDGRVGWGLGGEGEVGVWARLWWDCPISEAKYRYPAK